MANSSRKRGLLPAERILRETPYVAGGTIYPGDLVKQNSSGQVVVMAASDAVGAMGVAAHYATSGNPVLVWDDPNQKFEAQMKTGLTVAQTHVGNLFDIYVGSADTTYRQSRTEVDGSTAATSPSTLPLRMLAIAGGIDNAAGDLAKVIVQINCHAFRQSTSMLGT